MTCPLCHCCETCFVFTEREYDLRQCKDCGLFFIDPYPDPQQQFDVVADYSYGSLNILDPETHYGSSKLFYERYFPLLQEDIRSARRVLDVGCGTGRLLELIGQQFPQVACVGIELNEERARFAEKKLGKAVFRVPVEQFEAEQKFDVIYLMNVLSHVPDLVGLFQSLKRLLNDNGLVVFKTGEITDGVQKSAILDWDIPDHVHFLGLPTADYLAKRFGFEVVRHIREPLSKQIFSQDVWKARGRSKYRNLMKDVIRSIPGALPLMAFGYDRIHGGKLFSSLITLRLLPPDLEGSS